MPEWWNDLTPIEQSALMVVAAIVVYLFVRVVIIVRLERLAGSTQNDLDDRLVHFLRRFFGIALLFVVVLGVLDAHDVAISPLLAGAGIAGIALGFAAKETLSDVLAGVFLIVDRPMRVGDRVKIEFIGRDWGGWGDVVDIGLRRTRVLNTDGVVVDYPNHVLANSVITNFSQEHGPIRVRVRFQVDYAADVELACEVAKRAIETTEGVLPETTDVVVRGLWDDRLGHQVAGVLLEGRYRIADVRTRTKIRSVVLVRLHAALREAGVPLPAPRIHVERD